MFEEAKSDLLVHRISLSEDQRDFQHVLTIERHPCGSIGLVQVSSGGKFRAAVENTDIVQAEKAAREHIASVRILTVHPPVEVQHQALERAFQEANVSATKLLLNVVEKQCRPGMHRRINVTEVPLVCGNLPIRMRVEIPQHQ